MDRAAVIDHLAAALGEGWTVTQGETDAVIGHGGRGIVLVEGSDSVRVTIRGAQDRRKDEIAVAVAGAADLVRLAPVIDAARWWAGRVTPTNLRHGAKYFTRKGFVDRYDRKVPAGETLTFNRTDLQRYDHTYTILFLERRMHVREDSDVLADFDLYLEPVP